VIVARRNIYNFLDVPGFVAEFEDRDRCELVLTPIGEAE
jgi:hypothetical protein